VGFLGQLISVVGVLQRSFRVPGGGGGIPFFVMFRGGAMGVRGAFVQLGGFRCPSCIALPPVWEHYSALFLCARSGPIPLDRSCLSGMADAGLTIGLPVRNLHLLRQILHPGGKPRRLRSLEAGAKPFRQPALDERVRQSRFVSQPAPEWTCGRPTPKPARSLAHHQPIAQHDAPVGAGSGAVTVFLGREGQNWRPEYTGQESEIRNGDSG